MLKGNLMYNRREHHLFTDFKKAYEQIKKYGTFSVNLVCPWK